MEKRIEIPTSKTKAILSLIGCCLFIVICIWMLFNPTMPVAVKLVGIIGVVFFGLGLIVFPKLFANKVPGMIIDRYGITDNITKPEAGIIEWADITRIEIIHIMHNAMLAIYVAYPEKYLNSVNSWGLENNYRLTGTPFIIPSSILKIKLTELEVILNTKLKEYHYAGKS